MRFALLLALTIGYAGGAGCAASSGRAHPIPPHSYPPALDQAFFAGSPTSGGPAAMRVHLIDVGQGAATLIEFSCGAILIDTGGEENRRNDSTRNLMEYLREFFRSRPDLEDTLALLVLTHPHIDHTRGAPVVLDEFHVEHLVTDGLVDSSGGKQQKQALARAKAKNIPSVAISARDVPAGGLTSDVIDPVKCQDGDPDIRVLWGAIEKGMVRWDPKDFENRNNHSVVVKVTLGKSSLLITGDLEEYAIEELLAKHRKSGVLDVDLYQVGHHGSYNATTKELLAALTPRLALIACGPYDRHGLWTGWQYGHPRAVTIKLLEHALAEAPPRKQVIAPIAQGTKRFEGWEIKAPIYATGWDSDVIVTMTAAGEISVKTRRGN